MRASNPEHPPIFPSETLAITPPACWKHTHHLDACVVIPPPPYLDACLPLPEGLMAVHCGEAVSLHRQAGSGRVAEHVGLPSKLVQEHLQVMVLQMVLQVRMLHVMLQMMSPGVCVGRP